MQRYGVIGAPPKGTQAVEGDGLPDRPLARAVKGGLVVPPLVCVQESCFSSAQGWEFYKAVHKAAHAENGASESRLRDEAAIQVTHGQERMTEETSGLREVVASGRPVDQESSHGDSQRDWDAEQDWLQECAILVTKLALGLTWWDDFAP